MHLPRQQDLVALVSLQLLLVLNFKVLPKLYTIIATTGGLFGQASTPATTAATGFGSFGQPAATTGIFFYFI